MTEIAVLGGGCFWWHEATSGYSSRFGDGAKSIADG